MTTQEDINNIDVRHVVFLDTDIAGDLYMEKMYPLWCDVVVVTLEGKYPENPVLRERVLAELSTNKNIYCMFFGARAQNQLNIASERRLFVSNYLIRDLQVFGWQKKGIFELDESRIMELCMVFCNTMFDHGRLQSYNSVIDQLENNDSVKWYHHLIKS
jgi:hypothetical protein